MYLIMSKMRIIDSFEIEKLNISSLDAIRLVDITLKEKHNDILPPKISMQMAGHKFINVMPAVLPALNVAGVKVVSRYPYLTPTLKSQLLLYDLGNGELKALLDAKYITSLRTAAVAVHSMKLLAKSKYSKIAIIGLGDIGEHILKILIETLDRNVELRLFNYKNRATSFINKYATSSYKIDWRIYDDYEIMCKDSDVIFSAVSYMDDDFASAEIYPKGVLIVPVHTRGYMACDLVFDKIICDDKAHVSKFKYFDCFKNRLYETSEILTGTAIGRESDEQRILSYSIGIAIHDVAFAEMIYNKILGRYLN